MGNLISRRKAGQTIVLNNVITITVVAVEGDRVKLSVQAPPDVIVVRGELLNDGDGMCPVLPLGVPTSG